MALGGRQRFRKALPLPLLLPQLLSHLMPLLLTSSRPRRGSRRRARAEGRDSRSFFRSIICVFFSPCTRKTLFSFFFFFKDKENKVPSFPRLFLPLLLLVVFTSLEISVQQSDSVARIPKAERQRKERERKRERARTEKKHHFFVLRVISGPSQPKFFAISRMLQRKNSMMKKWEFLFVNVDEARVVF